MARYDRAGPASKTSGSLPSASPPPRAPLRRELERIALFARSGSGSEPVVFDARTQGAPSGEEGGRGWTEFRAPRSCLSSRLTGAKPAAPFDLVCPGDLPA